MEFRTILFLCSVLTILGAWLGHVPARAEDLPHGGIPNTLESVVRVDPAEFRAIPDGIWHRIRLGEMELDDLRRHVDDPQLPVMVKWFLLPPGTTIADVTATTLQQTEVEGTYLPYPIRDEQDDLDNLPDTPPWDAVVFPREQVFLSQVGEARRYQLAKIALYPLQYDAPRQSIRILDAVLLSVNLRPQTTKESREMLQIRRPEAADDPFRVHRRWIRSIVENPEDLDRFYPVHVADPADNEGDVDGTEDGGHRAASLVERTPFGSFVSEWPSTEGRGVDYLIITNNYDESGNYVGEMEALFQAWGEELYPLSAAVRTVDMIEEGYDSINNWRWTGYDRADRIRNYIQLAVERWGVTYVLLGGDESVVPARRLGGPSQTDLDRPDPICDYWYSRVGSGWAEGWNTDGDAWIGEDQSDFGMTEYHTHGFSSIFVTRLPARSYAEASNMIIKTYHYLQTTGAPPAEWYRKALAAAGPTNSSDLNSPDNGIPTAEYVLDPIIDQGTWEVQRLYPKVGGATYPGCPAAGDTCYLELHHYIRDRVGDRYWEGGALRDSLSSPETAPHLFYHVERSKRDRLGRPTGDKATTVSYDCPGVWKDEAEDHCPGILEGILRSIEHLDINQVLSLRNGAQNQHRYMFVFSGGGWTNMMDMNSIGESFLRAPNGGAVFYVGKAAAYGGLHSGEYKQSIQNAFVEGVFPISAAVYLGIDENFGSSSDYDEVRAAADLNLLGDAVLFPYTTMPLEPDLALSPSTITALGVQSLTVTVTNPSTSSPIEGALVGVRQGDWTSASMSTDALGQAAFKGILIQNAQDTVHVSVLRPGFLPTVVTVPVQVSGAYVVYAGHELDDCVTGGDCDGVFEAGETCEIDVTLKNEGSSASQMGFAMLRPTPPFVAKLQINDAYRPGDIYLGSAGAHPGAEADTFRVPLSQRGIRFEGTPPTGSSSRKEIFRVWRSEGTGLYTIAAYSYSQSGDSVFTGIIKGEADFSNVSMTGEGSDQYYASGDSIWFEFHGDATEDKITFRAEAPNWFTMNTSTVSLPALQPGATTTVTFSATNLDDLPDRTNAVFTVSAYQGLMASAYFTSDFVIPSAKPEIVLVGLDREFGDFGCADTSWRWTPVIHNRGSGAADSVRLVLRTTAGSMTVQDSIVIFESVGPNTILVGDSFVLCGDAAADTLGFESTIREETYHKELYELVEIEGGGGCGLRRPANLRADLIDGTIVVRWDPVTAADRYLIEYGTSPTGQRTPIGEIGTEATRYQVHLDLESPGPEGYGTGYYFWVRACDDNGQCGLRSRVGPVFPWVREREAAEGWSWPKLLPGMSICAPVVADLGEGIEDGGIAIFAATDRVFGWRPDGTPLNSNASDGALCDPYDLAGEELGVDERFTEALAFGDLSDHTGVELAGNFRGKGIVLMGIYEENGEIVCSPHWDSGVYSNQSPIVAPYLAGVDETVLFLGGVSDPYIYGWFADDPSLPVGQSHRFATLPSGSAYSYESLAVGYNTDTDCHELIAMTREGRLWCFDACDPASGGYLQWELELDPVAQEDNEEFLSPPAVGDVDGDGDNDIVITTLWRKEATGGTCYSNQLVAGRLYVVDEESEDAISVESCDFHFRDESSDLPPAGPSLAQLDDDDALEILVAGSRVRYVDEQTYPVGINLHVFQVDNEEITYFTARDSIPYGTRNDEEGHPISLYGAQYPIGAPVVGDYDPDGEYAKPDIFVTTSQGAIFCFEYDYQADPPLYPKPGWPLLLPDVAREPVLAQLDPEDPGQFSLVVQCQDGYLHVYDLPKTSETGSAPDWASYGGDSRNTRGKLSGSGARPSGPEASNAAREPRISGLGPSPSGGPQEIVVTAAEESDLQLDLYDVAGRRVRNVYAGKVRPGSTILRWDGTLGDGQRAPSGIYWYRLRTGAGVESRRIVVVR